MTFRTLGLLTVGVGRGGGMVAGSPPVVVPEADRSIAIVC